MKERIAMAAGSVAWPVLSLALSLALLAGCAAGSGAASGTETGGRGDPRMGAQAGRICFSRNISNWRTIDGEGDALLLQEGVRDWRRVELVGAGCGYPELRFVQRIALETRPAGGCVATGDVITLLDPTGVNRRCTITRINEWDETARPPDDRSDNGAAETSEDGDGEA